MKIDENLDLIVKRALPQEIIKIKPQDFLKYFKGPTLLKLPSERNESEGVLFVTIALHGDEITGPLLLQKILKKYKNKKLPSSVWFFIGNVWALHKGERKLDHQKDFNRIWKTGSSPYHFMAEKVLDEINKVPLKAHIDVQNNHGLNHHYALIARASAEHVALAQLFSNNIIQYDEPKSSSTQVISNLCPSVTLEAGLSGDKKGVKKSFEMIEYLLHHNLNFNLDQEKKPETIYHMVGKILVPETADVSFKKFSHSHFGLRADLEELNLTPLDPGTELGRHSGNKRLLVRSNEGHDQTEEFLDQSEGKIKVKKKIIPCMLTKKIKTIKDDCLGRILEKQNLVI